MRVLMDSLTADKELIRQLYIRALQRKSVLSTQTHFSEFITHIKRKHSTISSYKSPYELLKSNLSGHMKTKTRERSYVYQQCEKPYTCTASKNGLMALPGLIHSNKAI